jgi:hypothetical protein
MKLAHCIGCKCHDRRACLHPSGRACSWLAVDYEAGKGICDACPGDLARWNAGDRTPAVVAPNGDKIS